MSLNIVTRVAVVAAITAATFLFTDPVEAQNRIAAAPLSADDARVAQVRGVLEPLARGDVAAATHYLHVNAAPESSAAKDAESQIAALSPLFTNGRLTMGDVLEGPEGGLVAVLDGPEGMVGVEVQLEGTPPFRIREVLPSRMTVRRSAG